MASQSRSCSAITLHEQNGRFANAFSPSPATTPSPRPHQIRPIEYCIWAWHTLLLNRHRTMACQSLPRCAITLHEQNARFANVFPPYHATTPSPRPHEIHPIGYCIWAWHTWWLNSHRTMACQSRSRSAITLREQNGRFANAFSPSPATTPSPRPHEIRPIEYCVWVRHTWWLNRHRTMACQSLPRSAITLHEQNGRFVNAFSPSPATTPSPKPHQIHAIEYCIWARHTWWLNRHRTMTCQSLPRSAITLHEQNGRFLNAFSPSAATIPSHIPNKMHPIQYYIWA